MPKFSRQKLVDTLQNKFYKFAPISGHVDLFCMCLTLQPLVRRAVNRIRQHAYHLHANPRLKSPSIGGLRGTEIEGRQEGANGDEDEDGDGDRDENHTEKRGAMY